MRKFINFIVKCWRSIIQFRENRGSYVKGIWDAFWYGLVSYALCLIIFAFFSGELNYATSAWIGAIIAVGIGFFVFLYVIFVEEKVHQGKNVKTRKKSKKDVDVITLADLEKNTASTGQTEVIDIDMPPAKKPAKKHVAKSADAKPTKTGMPKNSATNNTAPENNNYSAHKSNSDQDADSAPDIEETMEA